MGKKHIETDLREAFEITRRVMGKAPATVVAEVFLRMCRNTSRQSSADAAVLHSEDKEEIENLLYDAFRITRRALGKAPARVVADVFVQLTFLPKKG
ncbi:hypothetical protein ACMHYO_16125 [Allopusillimonas ginsengisoli]|uniref:hypothetical protein n=1 Tax=Allopusillimonas ginsengisoli TaxID=453575 RepID=UPI0039C334C3